MSKFSPLQMTDATSWSGLTTKNHLATIFQASPQVASKVITKIFNANVSTTTDTYMDEVGAVLRLKDDTDYTWRLMGSAKKNLPLVQARIAGTPITAASRCGQNHSEFEVVFSEHYFHDVQLIVGHKNERYSLQILDDPTKEGTNFVYRVKLMTGDSTLFMPYEELLPGKRFSKDWTPVEQTLSEKGSPVDYTSPFDMRNAISFLRKEQTFAGNMLNRPFGTAFKDDKGNTFMIWEQYASYQMDVDMMTEKNYALVFSTANRAADGTYKNVGKSGYFIVQGAGLRQQSECSYSEYYTNFTIDLPTNMLVDLSEGRLKSDSRNFIMKTGERGGVKFHKALENNTALYTPNRDNDRIYNAAGKKGVNMPKGYGGQFVEYKAPNGVVLGIEMDSAYDDRVRNKVYHPEGGVAESHRFDIFDLGTQGGEANIQKVTVDGSEYIMGIEPGLRNPLSADGKRNIMSTAKDGWKEHRACYISGMVIDPTKTAALIPDILE
jgi:hypothetical protein